MNIFVRVTVHPLFIYELPCLEQLKQATLKGHDSIAIQSSLRGAGNGKGPYNQCQTEKRFNADFFLLLNLIWSFKYFCKRLALAFLLQASLV